MPAILLIPGNMCDERLWQPVAEDLASAGHIVRHAPLLDQGSIGEMADAVRADIDTEVVAIGFSMGAIVGAELARRFPEAVAAVGLFAFNAMADLPERAAARLPQQEAVKEGRLEAIVSDELKPHYLGEANRRDPQLLDIVMQMARALGPEVFLAQSEALRLRDDLRPALPDFDMPVLLSCGSEDRLCPPQWHREWAELIGANAQFKEIGGAGHLLPLEQPKALAATLLAWLAKGRTCRTAS
jgi:pimeloyl-ACP methyl ester carboxylesterase